jgi:hypothetical protein
MFDIDTLIVASRVAAKVGICVVFAVATPRRAEKRSDITVSFVIFFSQF